MTQTKTVKDLRDELVMATESWWMDAAAKTICEAHLQDRFRFHLEQRFKAEGHPEHFRRTDYARKAEAMKKLLFALLLIANTAAAMPPVRLNTVYYVGGADPISIFSAYYIVNQLPDFFKKNFKIRLIPQRFEVRTLPVKAIAETLNHSAPIPAGTLSAGMQATSEIRTG